MEVDQSGKVEQLNTGTAVAFSNGERRGLFISTREKRLVVSYLKRSPSYAGNFGPIFFAVLVYLLIRNEKFTSVLIDEEYTGKEEIIERVITRCWRSSRKIPLVQFGLVGRLAPVHIFVWKIHRAKGRDLRGRKITAKEILRLLK